MRIKQLKLAILIVLKILLFKAYFQVFQTTLDLTFQSNIT